MVAGASSTFVSHSAMPWPPERQRRRFGQVGEPVQTFDRPRLMAALHKLAQRLRALGHEHVVGVLDALWPVDEREASSAEDAGHVLPQGVAGAVAVAAPDEPLGLAQAGLQRLYHVAVALDGFVLVRCPLGGAGRHRQHGIERQPGLDQGRGVELAFGQVNGLRYVGQHVVVVVELGLAALHRREELAVDRPGLSERLGASDKVREDQRLQFLARLRKEDRIGPDAEPFQSRSAYPAGRGELDPPTAEGRARRRLSSRSASSAIWRYRVRSGRRGLVHAFSSDGGSIGGKGSGVRRLGSGH